MKDNLNFLVEQLKKGNELAFTQLYDIFSKPLYRSILRLVKDEDITQELLQDLFLKIWEKRESIKPDSSFKSYLYKVAENLAYQHFRKVGKNDRLIAKLIMSYSDLDSNAEEKMISREDHQLLKRAIEHLAPKGKQVYTLCKLNGKSYEEAAEELGISKKTVSGHIVQANKDVKRYFRAK